MKRLVWLLLPIFCTLLVQVQPVEPLPLVRPAHKCCCDCGGKCGMPDCAPPAAAPGAVVLFGEPPVAVTEAKRTKEDLTRQRMAEKFPTSRIARADRISVGLILEPPVPVAGVPLFREHCCLLL